MQEASAGVARWREQRDQKTVIKITAGAWTSRFITQHLASLPKNTSFRLMPDNHFFDLRRREAHLAIRNRRPSQQGLAIQKLGRVAFAIYGVPQLAKAEDNHAETEELLGTYPWITYEPEGAPIPSTLWLRELLTQPPALSCSSPTLVLDAALAGIGLCVIPCFIGDHEPRLKRFSDPIDELTHVPWLVSHNEDRHLKAVRQTSRALHNLIMAHNNLFSGQSPTAP